MSLGQLNIFGKDKVQVSIDRIKSFEPPEGYYLAFSGGKDSVCIKALADMAGVKYDAHYSVTTVDPPELVWFIKENHPDVIFEKQYWKEDGMFHKKGDPITMWNLIPEQLIPPTRISRYCCAYLKEQAGHERFVITGVRWAESAKRSRRCGLEVTDYKSKPREHYDPDNPDQELIHLCMMKKQRILNPIIDWTEDEVWEFIKGHNLPYCKLYDEGMTRLGCVGCQMAGKRRQKDFDRWPKMKRHYMVAFEKMVEARKARGLECRQKTAEEVMRWWMEETDPDGNPI